jgi:hemerythrin
VSGKVAVKDLLWDNILSVRVQEIDDDHRKLVNLFNLLNHAVKKEARKHSWGRSSKS